MTLKSLALFMTAFVYTVSTYGQAANAVDITPHWKNNETHAVKIRSTTDDSNNGNTVNYLSTFDAKFTAKEVSGNGYKISHWINKIWIKPLQIGEKYPFFGYMLSVRSLTHA